ncbi:LytR/AlgR family response regulator transcription factor [Spirosoma daeguense]
MTFYFEQSTRLSAELLTYPPISILIPDIGRQSIPLADLVYIEAQESYSAFHVNAEKRFQLARPLKYHHDKLPPYWFIRIHRNYVVNRRYVERLDSTDEGYWIHLSTGLSLPVARRRWRDVCEQMMGDLPQNIRSLRAFFNVPKRSE